MPLIGGRQPATWIGRGRALPCGSGCERGASAVEFAILLPIFIMLVFGGIYGGIAIDHKIGITQAAREGARFGSTLPIPAGNETAWLDQVMQATEGAASSDIAPGSNNSTVCVAFVDASPGSATLSESLDSTGGTGTPQPTPCYTDDSAVAATQRVQVAIGRDVIFDIGIASWTLHLTSTATVQYERPSP